MLKIGKLTLFGLALAGFLMSASAAGAVTIEYDGLIEPYAVVDIGSAAEGIVATVAVDRGAPVSQGQTVVELESSVEQAAVEKAKTAASFHGEINLQLAQLAFAKRVHTRVKKLSAISDHDKDQAATEIVLTGQRLVKARENKAMAKHELERARALLARRSIQSPISGVVVDRFVSPGEYINNQPVLRVAQLDPLRVEVIIPAGMFGRINPGMTATIIPELSRYGEQTATVTIVDKVIDSASNTFGVRLEMPNARKQTPSGLKCIVRFEIGEETDTMQ
ncbi:MAG: efflux RND transporter periplasmic adaptor subunit [Desulfobacteraceae bacterium]|nr:efflux RND transporter periplasmic adaptor subunit [Desulfobacteraceae bacterium]